MHEFQLQCTVSIYALLNCFTRPDRIEDGEEAEWQGERNVNNVAVTYPLDPTRWWAHAGMLEDQPEETGGR